LGRPVTMHVTPTLVNASKPNDVKSYRWLEDWRMERQPLHEGPVRYNWVFNGRDVTQWRIFLPPRESPTGERLSSSTYAILFDWDATRQEFRFFNTPRHFGRLNIADGLLMLHGNGRINLGQDIQIYSKVANGNRHPFLYFSDSMIAEKNGKKFVRVGHDLGIPLESLK
jgi:hypothetical protein